MQARDRLFGIKDQESPGFKELHNDPTIVTASGVINYFDWLKYTSEIPESMADHGHFWEEEIKYFIAQNYDKYNLRFLECGFLFDSSYPWLGALPDGLCYSEKLKENVVVEIKCPVFGEPNCHIRYIFQMIIQMHVFQVKYGFLFVMRWGKLFTWALKSSKLLFEALMSYVQEYKELEPGEEPGHSLKTKEKIVVLVLADYIPKCVWFLTCVTMPV